MAPPTSLHIPFSGNEQMDKSSAKKKGDGKSKQPSVKDISFSSLTDAASPRPEDGRSLMKGDETPNIGLEAMGVAPGSLATEFSILKTTVIKTKYEEQDMAVRWKEILLKDDETGKNGELIVEVEEVAFVGEKVKSLMKSSPVAPTNSIDDVFTSIKPTATGFVIDGDVDIEDVRVGSCMRFLFCEGFLVR